MYDTACCDKGRSSGGCVALAATIVYTLNIIVWVGYDRACLLLAEYEYDVWNTLVGSWAAAWRVCRDNYYNC